MSVDDTPPVTNDDEVLIAALDHSWKWFELHAKQRLQFVNNYILAAALLAAAITQALTAREPLYAASAVVSGAGVVITGLFFFVERRVRGLIHEGEVALSPLQKAINNRLRHSIPAGSFEIVDRADTSKAGEWKYSSVIGTVYIVFADAFFVTLIWSVAARAKLPFNNESIYFAVFLLLLGLAIHAATWLEKKHRGNSHAATSGAGRTPQDGAGGRDGTYPIGVIVILLFAAAAFFYGISQSGP